MHQSSTHPSTTQARIAFIQARVYKDLVDQCRYAFTTEMSTLGWSESRIDFIEVPGAFEIPLRAKLLAKSGRYAGIVAAGLVADGGIYRHEFVAQAVISSLMDVQIETEVPVFSAVLTPHHFHSHHDHQQFFHAHFAVKGKEVAGACVDIIGSMARLQCES